MKKIARLSREARLLSAVVLCGSFAFAAPAPELTTVTFYEISPDPTSIPPPPGATGSIGLEEITNLSESYKYLGTDQGGSTSYQLAYSADYIYVQHKDETTTVRTTVTWDYTATYVRGATSWRMLSMDREATVDALRCAHTVGGHADCVYDLGNHRDLHTTTGWSVPEATLAVDTESGDVRILRENEGDGDERGNDTNEEESWARMVEVSLRGLMGAVIMSVGLIWL